MLMLAAILEEYGKVATREVEIPKLPPGEVLLKVAGCGVCGTDVHLAAGEIPLAKPPVVLGHEIAAEVSELGAGTDGFEIGESVVVDPLVGCGSCKWCRQGQTNLCSSPTIIGCVRSGGFCQYLSVPAGKVFKVPSSLGAKGGILVETLACVVRGYELLAPRPGNTVMIVGAGTVGLLWLQLLKHSLTTFTVQTDLVASRAATAKTLGADLVFTVGEKTLAENLHEHGIDDFDLIIDATGSPQAISDALPFLGKRGRFMIFGVCPEEGHVQVSPYELFAKEQTILSSKMPPQTFDQSISLINAGVIDCETLVNRTLPLAHAAEALRMFVEEKDKAIKMMINPWA